MRPGFLTAEGSPMACFRAALGLRLFPIACRADFKMRDKHDGGRPFLDQDPSFSCFVLRRPCERESSSAPLVSFERSEAAHRVRPDRDTYSVHRRSVPTCGSAPALRGVPRARVTRVRAKTRRFTRELGGALGIPSCFPTPPRAPRSKRATLGGGAGSAQSLIAEANMYVGGRGGRPGCTAT